MAAVTSIQSGVLVRSWSSGLDGAIKGPFRAVIRRGSGPDVWKCRHRHPTMQLAFECGERHDHA